MKLIQNSEILLKIYSLDHLLRCRVDEVSEKELKLSPLSGEVGMFQTNDPVVLLYYEGRQLKTVPADVLAIDTSAGQVVFNRPEMAIFEERRIFERYPVSLVVSARRKFSSKRLHFIAKNISLYGLGAISEEDLEEEELLDIDLITDKAMFYFSGRIIWKKAHTQCFEYGIQLTHVDVVTRRLMEEYLEGQNAEYERMISKAR
jgi:hypothetical protein